MTEETPHEPNYDIFPRDQVEHYKIELSRLRSENERLTGEVDYLRQALAAALSKIPQIEATTPPPSAEPAPSKSAAVPAEPDAPPEDGRRPWEYVASLRSYAGFFPIASMIAPPVIFMILLLITLACALGMFGFYVFLVP